MNFYELVLIIRHDLATNEVDNIVENISTIVQNDHAGQIVKTEYWNILNLKYLIKKHKKAHYMLVWVSAPEAGLSELERKLKLQNSILRFAILRVDSGPSEVSPILKTRSQESEMSAINLTNKPRSNTQQTERNPVVKVVQPIIAGEAKDISE